MRTVNPKQHARRRAAILRAAAVEFAQAGIDGASTTAIYRRAKIGSGTLFHYFPNKRSIFVAVFADAMAGHAEVVRAALDLEPRAGIGRLIDHLVADFDDPLLPGLSAAALLQANRDPEFAQLLADDSEQTRHALETLLRRWTEEGHQLAFPPDRTARWILRVVDGCYLAADDPEFDAAASKIELRSVVASLLGEALA